MRSSLFSLLLFNFVIKKYILVTKYYQFAVNTQNAPLCNPPCPTLGNKMGMDGDFCLCL